MGVLTNFFRYISSFDFIISKKETKPLLFPPYKYETRDEENCIKDTSINIYLQNLSTATTTKPNSNTATNTKQCLNTALLILLLLLKTLV